MAQEQPSSTTSSPLRAFIYWAIVAVPLTWGVYKTVIKSQPLFAGTSATASATPAAAATPTPMASTPAPLAPAAPAALDPTVPASEAPSPSAQPSETVAPTDAPTVPKT